MAIEIDLIRPTVDLFTYSAIADDNSPQDKPAQKIDPDRDGFIYHRILGDTHAVQLDCTGKSIEDISEIQTYLIQRSSTVTIGETWLVWGQLPNDRQDALETAKNCFQRLQLPNDANWDRDLFGKGTIANATFYELWSPREANEFDDRYHLLILLFDAKGDRAAINNAIKKLFADFLRLFHYRNKIFWAYRQSRQLRQNLKQPSNLIPKIVNNTLTKVNSAAIDLAQLQDSLADMLKVMVDYSANLNYLEEQRYTIEVNLDNYQKRLQQMEGYDGDVTLDPFHRFHHFARDKYLQQIQNDRASLTPGLTLLENSIRTIEGINQIEQTKSDRSLEKEIAAVGIGVGTASAAASSVANFAKQMLPQPLRNSPGLGFILAFTISIGIGYAFYRVARFQLRGSKKGS